MIPPLVSCLCPTFGRFPAYGHLLGETVQCFIDQDYENKELVILNDCPRQTLVCSAPGVRVFNLPYRYPTLGQKFDALCALAMGDVLLPWEDDDWSLSHRISQAVEVVGDPSAPTYFNPGCHWLHSLNPAGPGDYAGGFRIMKAGVNHNASAFTRAAWQAAGGYPATTGDQDMAMDGLLRTKCEVLTLSPRQTPAYVYRWGVSPIHLSSASKPPELYAAVGRDVKPGCWEITPERRYDYGKMVADFVQKSLKS